MTKGYTLGSYEGADCEIVSSVLVGKRGREKL